MIIRSIRVSGWRCLGDPIHVKELSDGINILHAPNGTGKSSLFEALVCAMFDLHGTSGKDMQEIRSWGKELAPTVEVEFSDGGKEYRLWKRFLIDAGAKLEKKEGDRFTLIAEDREADNKVRLMLSKNPPGKGLSRFENWGLAQVLWAKQGELAYEGLSGDLLDKIKASLGSQLSTAGTSELEKLIESAYSKYFTDTGKHRSGKDASQVTRLEEALRQATERQRDANDMVLEFDEESRKVEDLRARKDQAQRELHELEKTVKEARAKQEQYKNLISEKKEREARRGEAENKYQLLKTRNDAIREARETIAILQPAIKELCENLQLLERELESRTAAENEANAVLEKARSDRNKTETDRELAAKARKFVDQSKLLATHQERLNQVRKDLKAIESKKKERGSFLAPDQEQFKNIRNAFTSYEKAKASLDAALITLEIEPLEKTTATVILGDQAGEAVKIRAGAAAQFQGSPKVQVEFPGFGKILARGPASDVEDLRKTLEKAERKWADLTDGYQEKDLNSIEELHQRRAALDAEFHDAETQLEAHLNGEEQGDLEQELLRLTAAVDELAQEHPEWKKRNPAADKLESEAAEKIRASQRSIQDAENKKDIAQESRVTAQKRLTEDSAKLKNQEKEAMETEKKLADLLKDGLSDAKRNEVFNKCLMEWDTAKTKLAEIEEKLASLGGNPAEEVEKLERQMSGIEKQAQKARIQEAEKVAILNRVAEEGPYSRLTAIEEAIQNLQVQLQAEQRRAVALSLLRETVLNCKEDALQAVAGPVQAVATRTLHRVSGERLGNIVLGESLDPTCIKPSAANTEVSIECASGGEQEQIYLATRLALAEVLSMEERQLVVLDDVLLATDAGRLARVMRVLEEAAERLQILILTCHQERYMGLANAKMIDLEKIRAGTGW